MARLFPADRHCIIPSLGSRRALSELAAAIELLALPWFVRRSLVHSRVPVVAYGEQGPRSAQRTPPVPYHSSLPVTSSAVWTLCRSPQSEVCNVTLLSQPTLQKTIVTGNLMTCIFLFFPSTIFLVLSDL